MRWLALVCVALGVCAAGPAQAEDSGRVTGLVRVSPLSVEVVRPAEPLRRGRWFRIVAQVSNAGAIRLSDVSVTLVRPQELIVQGPATQVIPRVPGQASRRARWEVCSNTPGAYVVLARGEVGPFASESPATLVQIVPSNRTC